MVYLQIETTLAVLGRRYRYGNELMLTRFLILMTLTLTSRGIACSGAPSPAQRLVIACHRVDIKAVVTLLRSGVDVNGKFGEGISRTRGLVDVR